MPLVRGGPVLVPLVRLAALAALVCAGSVPLAVLMRLVLVTIMLAPGRLVPLVRAGSTVLVPLADAHGPGALRATRRGRGCAGYLATRGPDVRRLSGGSRTRAGRG